MNSNIDEIYQMLDALKDENIKASNDIKIVKKPKLKTDISNYSGRYDYFCKLLRSVDYDINNSNTYVLAHNKALDKYLKMADLNRNDLEPLKIAIDKEIDEYSTKDKSDIAYKGYYDGLLYVYLALRKSKDELVDKIYKILKKELG